MIIKALECVNSQNQTFTCEGFLKKCCEDSCCVQTNKITWILLSVSVCILGMLFVIVLAIRKCKICAKQQSSDVHPLLLPRPNGSESITEDSQQATTPSHSGSSFSRDIRMPSSPEGGCCCLPSSKDRQQSIPRDDVENIHIPGVKGRRRIGRPVSWRGSQSSLLSKPRELENIPLPSFPNFSADYSTFSQMQSELTNVGENFRTQPLDGDEDHLSSVNPTTNLKSPQKITRRRTYDLDIIRSTKESSSSYKKVYIKRSFSAGYISEIKMDTKNNVYGSEKFKSKYNKSKNNKKSVKTPLLTTDHYTENDPFEHMTGSDAWYCFKRTIQNSSESESEDEDHCAKEILELESSSSGIDANALSWFSSRKSSTVSQTSVKSAPVKSRQSKVLMNMTLWMTDRILLEAANVEMSKIKPVRSVHSCDSFLLTEDMKNKTTNFEGGRFQGYESS